MEGKKMASSNQPRRAPRLAGAALALLAAVAASNCADQREPECTVPASSAFAVRLVERGAPAGACDDVPALKGGVFGARPHPVPDAKGYPDYDTPFNVSIQFREMGDLRAAAEARAEELGLPPPAAAGPLYNFGPFASAKPSGDLCTVPTTEPARLVLPELPGVPEVPADPGDPDDPDDDTPAAPAKPPLPAVDVTALWSDVRFLSTTAYPGVQLQGTFTYTFNGCTRTYLATGVWGSFNVECGGSDDEGEPTGEPDQALCEAKPNPANVYGTGINPDFPVSCDPDTLLCLLDGDFPAVRR
jgi:hypothetical protein